MLRFLKTQKHLEGSDCADSWNGTTKTSKKVHLDNEDFEIIFNDEVDKDQECRMCESPVMIEGHFAEATDRRDCLRDKNSVDLSTENLDGSEIDLLLSDQSTSRAKTESVRDPEPSFISSFISPTANTKEECVNRTEGPTLEVKDEICDGELTKYAMLIEVDDDNDDTGVTDSTTDNYDESVSKIEKYFTLGNRRHTAIAIMLTSLIYSVIFGGVVLYLQHSFNYSVSNLTEERNSFSQYVSSLEVQLDVMRCEFDDHVSNLTIERNAFSQDISSLKLKLNGVRVEFNESVSTLEKERNSFSKQLTSLKRELDGLGVELGESNNNTVHQVSNFTAADNSFGRSRIMSELGQCSKSTSEAFSVAFSSLKFFFKGSFKKVDETLAEISVRKFNQLVTGALSNSSTSNQTDTNNIRKPVALSNDINWENSGSSHTSDTNVMFMESPERFERNQRGIASDACTALVNTRSIAFRKISEIIPYVKHSVQGLFSHEPNVYLNILSEPSVFPVEETQHKPILNEKESALHFTREIAVTQSNIVEYKLLSLSEISSSNFKNTLTAEVSSSTVNSPSESHIGHLMIPVKNARYANLENYNNISAILSSIYGYFSKDLLLLHEMYYSITKNYPIETYFSNNSEVIFSWDRYQNFQNNNNCDMYCMIISNVKWCKIFNDSKKNTPSRFVKSSSLEVTFISTSSFESYLSEIPENYGAIFNHLRGNESTNTYVTSCEVQDGYTRFKINVSKNLFS